jgi:hypothetical protein
MRTSGEQRKSHSASPFRNCIKTHPTPIVITGKRSSAIIKIQIPYLRNFALIYAMLTEGPGVGKVGGIGSFYIGGLVGGKGFGGLNGGSGFKGSRHFQPFGIGGGLTGGVGGFTVGGLTIR